MPAAQTKESWLSKHVSKDGLNGCWNAHGKCRNKPGWHVTFKSHGRRVLAHRAAWEVANGPIPDGLCVLHKCDNPTCCNPSHLFLGTQSDNANDMWNKGRARQGPSRVGIPSGNTTNRRLSKDDVVAMFEMYLAGSTQKAIASKFGITDVAVSCALSGKTYPEYSQERESIRHLLGRGRKKAIHFKSMEIST